MVDTGSEQSDITLRPEAEERAPPDRRRPYVAPELIEVGLVADVTGTGATLAGTDGLYS